MKETKEVFLKQLQTISKLDMMKHLTPFLYGEDAMLLKLYVNEATTPKLMAETLGITKGRVTALMNSLRKKDYISVIVNKEDARSYNLELTSKGSSYIEGRFNFISNYFDTLLDYIGLEESKALIMLLEVVIDKVKTFEVK
jgi:DNA-binding MarR family transcriptional regulator